MADTIGGTMEDSEFRSRGERGTTTSARASGVNRRLTIVGEARGIVRNEEAGEDRDSVWISRSEFSRRDTTFVAATAGVLAPVLGTLEVGTSLRCSLGEEPLVRDARAVDPKCGVGDTALEPMSGDCMADQLRA